MNASKGSTRLTNILSRMLAVIMLVSALLPAAPLGEASANSNPLNTSQYAAAAAAASTARVTQIVGGGTHTCALTPEGGVVCWGANDVGELGNGTNDPSAVPVAVSGLKSGVMSLSLKWGRTCALTTFGQVYCWGNSTDGSASSSVPLEVTGLGNQVVQLAAGEYHTCALTSSGKVLCWGYNGEGQLGNGTFTDSTIPVVAIASGAAQIAVQAYTSCAVMTNGEVRCWGDGGRGQLGDGGVAPEGGSHKSNVPVSVLSVGGSPLTGASQVELGLVFGCAVVGSGVQCWGRNRFGQLGNGVIINDSRPFAGPVLNAAGGDALSGADQLSTGESFACVHLTSGGLKCWGNNEMGQYGNGSTATSAVPVTVLNPAGTAPFEGAAQVTTGSWQTCVFTNWEAVHPFYCWGNNYMGQLGTGAVPGEEHLPQPVADIGGIAGLGQEPQIVAGGAHTCSFTSGRGLKCWGANALGQLGDGTTTDRLNPVDVAGLSSGVKGLALGDNFTCAIISWGRLKCWGENTHGQLGDGSKTGSALPLTAILPDVSVRQVAAGSGHTCVLTQSGSVLCWGDNTSGQLGDGSTTERTVPVVAIADSAAGIALGGSTSCAVLSGGGVKCWGLGDMGQLGNGVSGTGHHQLLAADVKLPGGGLLAGAKQVAVGANFACVLLEGGLVDCWGKNTVGQLGQGAVSGLSAFAQPVLTEAGGSPLKGATQVSAGGAHACVRMYTDRLKCWGQGEAGQLGDGSSGSGVYGTLPQSVVDHYAPYGQSIPYLEVVSQVSAGGAHTCAFLKWDGSNPYRCWGSNSSGQLGDGGGTTSAQLKAPGLTDRPYPNPVQDSLIFGSPPLAKIAAGRGFSCALTRAGGVKCWGDNTYGQIGDGTNTKSMLPVSVVGLSSGVIGLAAGAYHACALTSAGGVKCWGYNFFGQLGDGSTFPGANHNAPVDVVGLSSGVIELSLGRSHSCALTSTGGVKCWGENLSGGLGDGTNTTRSAPVDVVGLSSRVIGVMSGDSFTCALTSVGGVKCWGANQFGQLGNGDNIASYTPVNVTGLGSGVIGLDSGDFHACALTSVGGVKCWGENYSGQLGNGGNADSNTPVDVTGLSSGMIGVAAGLWHTCALTSSGGVKCWGVNDHGQLGDGTFTGRLNPVDVIGLGSNVTSLSVGDQHNCVVQAGLGPLRCWGNNMYGQLGIDIDPLEPDIKGPVVSRWLTADGLVEDEKGQVIILPHPNTVLVIPAQPLTAPVLVTATEETSPPPPCKNCTVPPEVPVVNVTVSSHVMVTVHWVIHFPNWHGMNRQQSADGLAVSNFNESTLNLYHYVDGTWVPMLPCTGCSLDTTNRILIATLDGPGVYAMMASTQIYVYLPLLKR